MAVQKNPYANKYFSDLVSFEYNGIDYKNQSCYSRAWPDFSGKFVLKPNSNETNRFQELSEILAAQGLYPNFFTIKDYELTIPKTETFPNCKNPRDLIYVNLCFYRWADNFPLMINEMIDLNNNSKLNFWQIFHYATAKYTGNWNHSFCMVSNTCNPTNLEYSIVLKTLPAILKNGRQQNTLPSLYNHNHGLITYFEGLTGKEKRVVAKSVEDILDEKYTEYYL